MYDTLAKREAAVEAAQSDFIATGSAEAWARYERALAAWLRPPASTVRPGSWSWHAKRQRADDFPIRPRRAEPAE